MIAFLLVTTNVICDHYVPLTGMDLIPFGALLSTALVVFSNLRHPLLNSGVCAALLVLQDLGFKLWGGGLHNVEGQLAFYFLFLVGAFLSAVLLDWAPFTEQEHAYIRARWQETIPGSHWERLVAVSLPHDVYARPSAHLVINDAHEGEVTYDIFVEEPAAGAGLQQAL
ncbi:hypothetical protein [Hymenobacter seoulensis]